MTKQHYTVYRVADESGEVLALPAVDPEEAAHAYVDGGSYAEEPRTYWIRCVVWEENCPQYPTRHVLVPVHPDPPPDTFEDGWEYIDVRGSGGGVLLTYRQGPWLKYVNTWDYCRQTGEQGLESIEYRYAPEED